jgi:DNA uptake protein ComE-like DNA-binding protein
MKFKEWLFNFFHFNKQERNGVFIMCIILSVLLTFKLLMPYLFSNGNHVQLIAINITPQSHVVDTIATTQFQKIKENDIQKLNQELFVFNPNAISVEDAQKLGFSAKLSHTLINFRSKGGKFFKSEDLKKLYGMTPKLYEQLESYILIPSLKKDKDSSNYKTKSFSSEKKVITKQLLEINSADSLSIVYLKGVGPAFTKRIIKYRKMLGGFHSVSQLKEVYGMTDSLYNAISSQILVNTEFISKMPINAIDFNSLRTHPYFNFQTASAIINFRNKHGRLTESDFKSLGLFNDEKLQKITPYLSF